MFGYIIPDKPNMFMKDYTMYRAYYCGICKSTGRRYGQLMRFATNYDITFLSLLLHGVCGVCPTFKDEMCVLNIKRKSIAKGDELTRLAVDINVLLAHYKLKDNIADDGGLIKRILDKFFLRRKYKKSAKAHPKIDEIMKVAFSETARLESAHEDRVDIIAHPFAEMLKKISEIAFKTHYSDALGDLMYNLGRWVYIMDAVDDISRDHKKKRYNPFLEKYSFTDKKTFLIDKQDDLKLLLNGCLERVANAYKEIKLKFTEGAVTNILWYGLLTRTQNVLSKGDKNWKKIRI